jgi:outer membrane protein assembly factor BamB
LHWLAADDGRIVHSFPIGPARLGCGRGVVAAGKVYWPTRSEGDQIRVFDLATGRPVRTIDLDRGRGGAAGNLLVAGDRTIVAAHDALYCFRPQGERPPSVDSRRTAAAGARFRSPAGNLVSTQTIDPR